MSLAQGLRRGGEAELAERGCLHYPPNSCIANFPFGLDVVMSFTVSTERCCARLDVELLGSVKSLHS